MCLLIHEAYESEAKNNLKNTLISRELHFENRSLRQITAIVQYCLPTLYSELAGLSVLLTQLNNWWTTQHRNNLTQPTPNIMSVTAQTFSSMRKSQDSDTVMLITLKHYKLIIC